MKLEGILNITGKPGLYKLISTGKNTVIVESLIDKKRIPVHSSAQVNMLEEIGIYTYKETKPLADILNQIAEKENGKATISHKSSENDLVNFFRKIITDYDEERVYISDIKKIIRWYNLMQKTGLIQKKENKKSPKKKTTKKKENNPK